MSIEIPRREEQRADHKAILSDYSGGLGVYARRTLLVVACGKGQAEGKVLSV